MKMSHVGIMVGNMDVAVEFYTKALGLEVVMGKTPVTEENETAIGRMCIAVFGEGFKGFNIAHLVTEDGVGFELFEMSDFEWWLKKSMHANQSTCKYMQIQVCEGLAPLSPPPRPTTTPPVLILLNYYDYCC